MGHETGARKGQKRCQEPFLDSGLTVIDAAPLGGGSHNRIFDVQSAASLDLSRATITGGNTIPDSGGAFLVSNATLTLDKVAVVGNTAGNGGAIRSTANSVLTITDSVFANNSAVGTSSVGGALATNGSASLTIGRSVFAKNTAVSGPNVQLGAVVTTMNSGGNLIENKSGADTFFAPDHSGPVDYVVTGIADTYNHVDDSYRLSVREAIDSANSTTGAEEIWLPAWAFLLTRERTASPTSVETFTDQGDLEVKDSLTIRGMGMNVTTVNWRPGVSDKVFELLGDYNNDGITDLEPGDVNSADYLAWRNQQGQSAPGLSADGDDDGDVDAQDYAIWSNHFGNTLMLHGVG